MRRLLFIFLAVGLLGGSVVRAEDASLSISTTGGTDNADRTKLVSNIGGLSLGYLKVGTDEVANLAWHPDFKFGPLGLGVDVNTTLTSVRPPEYENFVLRYVKYDDGKRGLHYGIIQNLTWGHGLLMKGYSTVTTGPVILNNEQLAFKGYVDFDSYVIRGLKTGSGIYGLRLEERVHPMLVLGQTFLNDSDGVRLAGTSEVQKVSAYALDASVPLPWGFEGYAEYAHLVEHGSGFSTGIGWGGDFILATADFLAEYRFLDNNFVPGYFNSDYETNPIDLASYEATGNAKNGYLAQARLKLMDMASAKLVYENYNESDAALEGELFARLIQGIEVTGYYKQPSFIDFRSLSLEEGAIIGGSIAYPVNPFTKIVVHYKKVYNPSTLLIEESQYYELRISI